MQVQWNVNDHDNQPILTVTPSGHARMIVLETQTGVPGACEPGTRSVMMPAVNLSLRPCRAREYTGNAVCFASASIVILCTVHYAYTLFSSQAGAAGSLQGSTITFSKRQLSLTNSFSMGLPDYEGHLITGTMLMVRSATRGH